MPLDRHRATFVVLRTPLLPTGDWRAWSEGLNAAAGNSDAAALAADRALLRGRLRDLVATPELREALLVASPSLDESIAIWERDPDGSRGQKIERALVRYFSRMCTRSTPYGLFAGCTVGSIGPQTRLSMAPRTEYRRRTRLDARYLFDAIEDLLGDPRARDELDWFPNSSLYSLGSELRYVRVDRRAQPWSFALTAVEETPHLQLALSRAANGSKARALIAQIAEAAEVTADEAADFVNELIATQLLEPSLPLGLHGADPLSALNDAIGGLASAPFRRAAAILDRLDRSPIGAGRPLYSELREALATAATPVPANVVHADLYKPGRIVIGERVIAEIAKGVELLDRLSVKAENPALRRFKEAFVARYEGASVPLLEALDPDFGIPYDPPQQLASAPPPLLDGLQIPSAERPKSWTRRDALLLTRVQETTLQGSQELVLSDDDLASLSRPTRPALPSSFAAFATIVASSARAVDEDAYRILLSVTGFTGISLLSRFGHLDARLSQELLQHARAEQRALDGVILAEIVHVPDGRVGNVIVRQRMRSAEIPYLARASSDEVRQLLPSSLRVSIEGGRVVLRSESGQEVLPVLSAAHEIQTRRSVGLYRFLGVLANQDHASFGGWDWGPLSDATFLPRVVAGRVILSRARWRLTGVHLKQLAQRDPVELVGAVGRLRELLSLPRRVLLQDFDHSLPVDFSNVLSVASFAQLAATRDSVTLVEMLPDEAAQCVEGPEGRFAHELVVPFVSAVQSAPRAATRAVPARVHPPGGEWLYAKIYSAESHADALLSRELRPLVERARSEDIVDRWFFIRYADPDFHLRIRLHGDPQRLRERLLPQLEDTVGRLMAAGRAFRLAIDTYVPELRRYGGAHAIEDVERIFHADSDAVVALLGRAEQDGWDDEARWHAAALGMETLATDLGFSRDQRRQMFRRAADALFHDLGWDETVRRQMGERYRSARSAIERLVTIADDHLAPAHEIFRARGVVVHDAVTRLRGLAERNELTGSLEEMALSILHMHVNRILPSMQRAQELMLCEFLARAHQSLHVRQPA